MAMNSTTSQEDQGGVLSLRLTDPSVREVILRYVASRDGFYLLAPADPSPGWASILMDQGPMVSWRVGDHDYIGRGRAIDDSRDRETLRRRFEATFGVDVVRRWFGSNVRGFVLRPFPANRAAYHELVEEYFDGMAERYDRLVQANPLDLQLRARSGEILSKEFEAGQRILEIGAGTGLETLPLARRGVQIIATDISGSMLDLLRKKARAEGLGDLIGTRRVRASDLHLLLDEFGPAAFDGAFSNFGALNCEPDMKRLPGVLARLLRPESRVVLTVWNRVCLSEMLISLMTARPRRAFSRLLHPVPVGQSRFGVPVFAWTAGEFARSFSPYFRVVRLTGMPVFVPPYDFARPLQRHAVLASALDSLDRRFSGRYPLNRMGDHFVMQLTRIDHGGGVRG